MTGLLNRRAFYEVDLPRRISRLQRSRETAALFFVDMDNFKQVNDVHGHQAGDDALLLLRDLLMEMSRPGDVIARLGGDELAMWLDGISEEVSERRANRLIEASQILRKFSGDDDNPLGISVGVAIYDPEDEESLDDLMARADAAMPFLPLAGLLAWLRRLRRPDGAPGCRFPVNSRARWACRTAACTRRRSPSLLL